MFGTKKPGKGITLIASNCELEGDVHFSDQLMVNGVIKGNVYAESGSKALVTVSEKGRVRGDIRVPNVVVNGKVIGDIHADNHVELSAKAEIKGNVFYNLIEMVMGSRVDGNLVHIQDGKEVRKEPKQPSKTASTGSKTEMGTENPTETQQKARPEAKSETRNGTAQPVSAVKSRSA